MPTTPSRTTSWSGSAKPALLNRAGARHPALMGCRAMQAAPVRWLPVTNGSDFSDVTIRQLRPDDDLDAQADLSERAFGTMSESVRVRWREIIAPVIAEGRVLGAFDGDRAVGGALFHDMRQWWLGRAVPMAGVAGVRVSPEDRGRGIGRRLMVRLLDEVADRGYPLSMLYPATMRLYRPLGWELAGSRYRAVMPSRTLRSLIAADIASPGRAAVLRRAEPGDAAAVISVLSRAHEAARDCGPLTRDAATVARWLAEPGNYAYIGEERLPVLPVAQRQRGSVRRSSGGRVPRGRARNLGACRLVCLCRGQGARDDRPVRCAVVDDLRA